MANSTALLRAELKPDSEGIANVQVHLGGKRENQAFLLRVLIHTVAEQMDIPDEAILLMMAAPLPKPAERTEINLKALRNARKGGET